MTIKLERSEEFSCFLKGACFPVNSGDLMLCSSTYVGHMKKMTGRARAHLGGDSSYSLMDEEVRAWPQISQRKIKTAPTPNLHTGPQNSLHIPEHILIPQLTEGGKKGVLQTIWIWFWPKILALFSHPAVDAFLWEDRLNDSTSGVEQSFSMECSTTKTEDF